MAQVFLSYDRDDAEKARPLALALEKAGHSVWWDLHVRGGAQFSKVIEEALKAADAVVVLWSRNSIESAWVRDEAAAGRDSGRLVPVTLDGTEPPLGFRQFQTIDLSSWGGRGRSARFRQLIDDINAVAQQQKLPIAEEGAGGLTASHEPADKRRTVSRRVVVVASIALLIAAAGLAWMLMGRSSSVPVVTVTSADSSPASKALARDLLVQLGTLQSARPNSLDLVSNEQQTQRSDLIFQTAVAKRGNETHASLILLNGKNRSLLWSTDIQRPADADADLKQQLGYTAAQVLGCAAEGMNAPGRRLPQQTLKTYLTACSATADLGSIDAASVVPMLRKVVTEAPMFEGAWAKLLLTEWDLAFNEFSPEYDPKLIATVRRDIAQARKLNPHMAEAYLIEFVMLPETRILDRSRLLDLAIERNPQHAEARSLRSLFLMSVGRVDEALADARRAVQLDPLSPSIRDRYISGLALAGKLDEALADADRAERLWPGATSIQGARYLVHLRTGDPKEALRLLRLGVLKDAPAMWVRLQETFLEARIDRSPEKIEAAVKTARAVYNRYPQSIFALTQTLVEFDRTEELFPILLNWQQLDKLSYVTEVLFRPAFSKFHNDPRFMQVAKHLGLLNFWRATGKWPDFCSRADLPYDCKAEAAKLPA